MNETCVCVREFFQFSILRSGVDDQRSAMRIAKLRGFHCCKWFQLPQFAWLFLISHDDLISHMIWLRLAQMIGPLRLLQEEWMCVESYLYSSCGENIHRIRVSRFRLAAIMCAMRSRVPGQCINHLWNELARVTPTRCERIVLRWLMINIQFGISTKR